MKLELLQTVAARFAMLVLGLATSVLTSRWLGPAGRGDYAALVVFANLIVQFSNLGLQNAMGYLVASSPGRFRAMAANSLWLSLVGAGGVAALTTGILFASGSWASMSPLNLFLAAALVPSLTYLMYAGNLLVVMGYVRAYSLLTVLGGVILLAALSLAAWQGGEVWQFMLATTFAWSATAVIMFAYLRSLGATSWRFRPRLMWQGMGYSLKSYVCCVLGFLLLRVNILLLEQENDPNQTGYYSLAMQVADILLILPSSFGLLLFRHLVRDETNRWRTTIDSLVRVGTIMFVASIATALTISPAIGLVFGEAFLPAAPVVLLALPGVMCVALSGVVSQYFAAVGIPLGQIGVWAGGLALLNLLALVAVPRWGACGAAATFSISMLAVLTGLLTLFRTLARQDLPQSQPQARPISRAA